LRPTFTGEQGLGTIKYVLGGKFQTFDIDTNSQPQKKTVAKREAKNKKIKRDR
jgi:hypothetical protein